MITFNMSVMTKMVITLFIGVAALALPATAQPPCPPGSTYHKVIKQMMYNGVCCSVEIEYCVGPAGNPVDPSLPTSHWT